MNSRQPARPEPAGAPGVGDIAPDFALTADNGATVDPAADQWAGQFMLFVFLPPTPAPLPGLAERKDAMAACGLSVFVIARARQSQLVGLKQRLGIAAPLLADSEATVARLYGCLDGGAVLLRPNRHILARLAIDQPDLAAAAIAATTAAQAARRDPLCHPPIIVVPDVLSRADCQRLITLYTMTGQRFVEPGHNVQDMTTDYKMRIPDYGRKDRIDHWMVAAEPNALVDARLRARLFPEIKKAFQYSITKRERYRIGCYEGERGGEAHGHRDNTAPIVAHRRFACSVNLNSEEFEGGGLRFPEYGEQHYRPETGAGIVFSSSILHEALHVTAGRRYVLLAFLYGDV
jgi:peroxiredoxin